MELVKPTRTFVDQSLEITSWESVKPYFESLVATEITTEEDFDLWLKQRSELDAVLEEDAAWRYIRMTTDTTNEAYAKSYTFFVTEIQPYMAPYEDRLNRKMIDCPFANPQGKSEAYRIYYKHVQSALDLFREENIPLEAQVNELSQRFGSISGAQTIAYEGETLTMQKAATFLKKQDATVRQHIFEKMAERRAQDVDVLDELFDELIQLRHQIALNAGFENYRDYKFKALGRFDYTKEDCFAFHKAIKNQIVPIVKSLQSEKLQAFGWEQFKPWDTEVEPGDKDALKPFENGAEMLDGTIRMFDAIDPYFGDCLRTMKSMGYLDLDSKPGKAPGGYNYPLYEIGVPFIFMNAVGAQRDLVTMVHEGGHAVHSFLSRDLALTAYKNLPSEVAELASMSMELLSMEQWKEFYHADDLNRAKKDQLETILKILPWIATIDEFQHWIYENPTHSRQERRDQWLSLTKAYGTGLTDWTGYEHVLTNSWQRQMHLYEVPFYYIEYGFAQLGALAVWKNSLSDFNLAVKQYKEALALGYSRSIPEVYKMAGIRFDFSERYLKELCDFIQAELNVLR